MSTNAEYIQLRDWYVRPTYFRSHSRRAARDFYRQCFRSQVQSPPNSIVALQAVGDARKPWLSTTTRERYYDKYSYLRKLRSIGEGKRVAPAHRVECDLCSAFEDLGGEINERTLEDSGWYLGPTQTLCPEHAENED